MTIHFAAIYIVHACTGKTIAKISFKLILFRLLSMQCVRNGIMLNLCIIALWQITDTQFGRSLMIIFYYV